MASSLSAQKAYLLEPITVIQPPDLETDDPSLATVILPAPPPLTSISSNRKESHVKRQNLISYLPASDPGTTYSGLMGGLSLNLAPSEEEGRLRKRARTERRYVTALLLSCTNNAHHLWSTLLAAFLSPTSASASRTYDHTRPSSSSRPQRSSARSLNVNMSQNVFSPLEVDHPDDQMDPTPSLRRTNSSLTVSDEESPDVQNQIPPTKSKSKDKGKGKEKASVRVKEEPQGLGLDVIETNGHCNEDHCSSCRSIDPPMDAHDVPEGDKRWYCPACIIKQKPPPRPRRSFMAPLLQQLQLSIPTEFELPEDIRSFFKDVTTGPKGSYQDVTEVKSLRTRFVLTQFVRLPY
ncbi:hypothetical protein M422DRAFT_268631 [Sphaerobolus stellatus SS14]|uniref:Uncharacterized protein n=1 Tax=Sphaerobolus stellatus (strain SS14) TaxID=990650 RepID=A0A0C9U6G2_SPHS4|nr:hypothetical protein M422DRAFT_268631 [Sphaerobolus stellatus SS14]